MSTYGKKTLTVTCESCDKMQIAADEKMICTWGTQYKILYPQKGKKVLKCKLVKEDK